jgi:alpha-glucosidase
VQQPPPSCYTARPREAVPISGSEWWRSAVVYEIYVRSFADSDGDGVGDLPGIRARLPYLRDLGVDGIWLTPFFPSPGADHGYDVADYVDVDPQFGTLADFDALVAHAHELGLRVTIDVVPNHTSSEHPWFRNALGDPSHPDRARYVFRRGRRGGLPNNWESVFGGPAWTSDEASGEYYLHLFAPEQPDLDWHNPQVRADFEDVLRFWLDRGVDGFRIDVAHGLFKDRELRDEPEGVSVVRPGATEGFDRRRAIDQPELHPLYRSWRELTDGYGDDRVLVGEVVLRDQERVARYVRPDELHLAFNFRLLWEPWQAETLRAAIDGTLAALETVGATATWVLENHDVMRLPSRYGSLQRARAAALLLLALPGTIFLYQGQELGLEEVDLPDELRQDPVFLRSGGARKGRDGCRVPIPWTTEPPGFGFTGGKSWLPIPESWGALSVAAQMADGSSTLALYRAGLAARRSSEALREGGLTWRDGTPGSLAFTREAAGDAVACVVNVDAAAVELPDGELLLASDATVTGSLAPDTAAWIRLPR